MDKLSRLLTALSEFESTPVNGDSIWVTELARCLRYSFLARRHPVKLELKTVMKMHIGTGLHIRLQRLLQKHGFEVEKRVELKTDLGFKVVGKIDVYDPEENAVYELKYTHFDKLDKVRFANYLRQLNYYVEMADASRGYLVIVHADGKVEEVKRPHFKTDLIRRANSFGIALEEGILPPKKPRPDLECAECPFHDICWGGKR